MGSSLRLAVLLSGVAAACIGSVSIVETAIDIVGRGGPRGGKNGLPAGIRGGDVAIGVLVTAEVGPFGKGGLAGKGLGIGRGGDSALGGMPSGFGTPRAGIAIGLLRLARGGRVTGTAGLIPLIAGPKFFSELLPFTWESVRSFWRKGFVLTWPLRGGGASRLSGIF